MVLETQFNPSTLKTIYNPATGKVQIVKPNQISSVCEWCDTWQPAWINLMLSDFADCICTPTEGGLWWVTTNGVAAILNGIHKINHSGGCTYYERFLIDATWSTFSNADCSTLLSQYSFYGLDLQVLLQESGVRVRIYIHACGAWNVPDCFWKFFEGNILYTGDDECGDTENQVGNEDGCAPCGITATAPACPTGDSGIAKVLLYDPP